MRYPQNSLLIPCSKAKFADFGQNSLILRASSKNSLLISLLFGALAKIVAFHDTPLGNIRSASPSLGLSCVGLVSGVRHPIRTSLLAVLGLFQGLFGYY